jgi:hypothetical protein
MKIPLRLKTVLLTAIASFLGIHAARSQSPAGKALMISPQVADFQYGEGVAVTPDGEVFVLWEEGFLLPSHGPRKLLLKRFSVEDAVVGSPFRIVRFPDLGCCGAMAVNANGNLVITFRGRQPNARRYGFSRGPQRLRLNSSEEYLRRDITSVAMDSRGDFVAVWESQQQEESDRTNGEWGIYGRHVDSAGVPVGPEFHVNSVEKGHQVSPIVSKAAATGSFVVVWETNPDYEGGQVAGQLFAATGERVGGEFRVGSVVAGFWHPHASVAMAPDGSFVVVWQEPVQGNAATYIILGQRFSPEGTPLGEQLRISEGLPGWQQYPGIASDPHGNFVVTWNEDGFSSVTMARLYRADGRPVTGPVALTEGVGQENAGAAFGWNGTFAIIWTDLFSLTGAVAHMRRFSASPGPELCLFNHGGFACDTGRTGGTAEIHHPFGGHEGIGLLGDFDGDGRADPCVFRSGRFLCDTAHDYGSAETQEGFGQSGDTPLLGDIDGDGRADACVFRDGRFLCDSAHDGQVHENVRLGEPGDVPLLGDADGDGRADPCLFRGGRFLCDTDHDGVSDREIHFGQPGDVPFLVDFDADGSTEACVYRVTELLCDTGHDGGTAETILTFGDGSGTPLIGNLDGL